MAGDDNEKIVRASVPPEALSEGAKSDKSADAAKSEEPGRLPDRVERALARAREAARADRGRKSGRWLIVIPIGVGALLLLLLMPRATEPDAVPLPRYDERNLAAIKRADDARVAAASGERLPSDVLAVGSAVRSISGLEAKGNELDLIDARASLEAALRVLHRAGAEEDLLSLRAVQTQRFLDALAGWERTGEKPADFDELGGGFVSRAEGAGWVKDRHLLLDDAQRRVAYKTVWNAVTHLEQPPFAPTLDEQRTLYAFYIQHPHPSESARLALLDQRRAATTPEACTKARSDEQRQGELWLADKIKRLGGIDPSYPTAFALGVVYYRAGSFDLATEAFTAFVDTHPDGPWALRARNHLKASLLAGAR